MARAVTLLTLAFTMMVAQAERLDFSSMIAASGTQCYLENIGETIQGKQTEPFQVKTSLLTVCLLVVTQPS